MPYGGQRRINAFVFASALPERSEEKIAGALTLNQKSRSKGAAFGFELVNKSKLCILIEDMELVCFKRNLDCIAELCS